MIKTVLFDLDGTLLPMDQEKFMESYFGSITSNMKSYGYENSEELVKVIWAGTIDMVKNDGTKENYKVFWNTFINYYGDLGKNTMESFNEYYANHFDEVKKSCGFSPYVRDMIKKLKKAGMNVVLASNPVFPELAQKKRMEWAGLDVEDFSFITTYENSHYCKPNPKYYEEILERLKLKPEECIMVGNDVAEDMVAESAGIKTFLITDCMINKKGIDIEKYNKGSFEDFMKYMMVENV